MKKKMDLYLTESAKVLKARAIELEKAFEAKDLKKVQQLIEAGAWITKKDRWGKTYLERAVANQMTTCPRSANVWKQMAKILEEAERVSFCTQRLWGCRAISDLKERKLTYTVASLACTNKYSRLTKFLLQMPLKCLKKQEEFAKTARWRLEMKCKITLDFCRKTFLPVGLSSMPCGCQVQNTERLATLCLKNHNLTLHLPIDICVLVIGYSFLIFEMPEIDDDDEVL